MILLNFFENILSCHSRKPRGQHTRKPERMSHHKIPGGVATVNLRGCRIVNLRGCRTSNHEGVLHSKPEGVSHNKNGQQGVCLMSYNSLV